MLGCSVFKTPPSVEQFVYGICTNFELKNVAIFYSHNGNLPVCKFNIDSKNSIILIKTKLWLFFLLLTWFWVYLVWFVSVNHMWQTIANSCVPVQQLFWSPRRASAGSSRREPAGGAVRGGGGAAPPPAVGRQRGESLPRIQIPGGQTAAPIYKNIQTYI